MTDEISENTTTESTIAPSVEPKKMRARRRTKAEMEAAAAAKKLGTRAGRRGTVAVQGATAAPVDQATDGAIASSKAGGKAVTRDAPSAAPTDGFADLLELEAENQKLRKALAQKLRAENVELRSKLGLK